MAISHVESLERRLFHYQVVPNSLSWPCQQTLAVYNPPALQLSYGYSDGSILLMDAGRGNLKIAQWQRERTGALQAGEMEYIS